MVNRSQIRTFSDAIARKFRPRKIVLFGSYAYGKPGYNSDVDLLVIMPRTRCRGERMSVAGSLHLRVGGEGHSSV